MRVIKRLCVAALVCALLVAFAPSAGAVACGGIDLEGGCLFTVTGGDTPDPDDGFAVTNAHDVPLWDFVQARDLDALGYPISQRWTDGPFTLQAFQKVILQWDPAQRRMNFFNTLDALANRYPEVELPFLPAHQVLAADQGASFGTIIRTHLGLLEQNAAIKERFMSEPDWLNLYGLPIRYEEREVDGNPAGVQLLRTQRTVFAVWNVPAPGTTIGQVLLQNLPDQVKKLSNVIIPDRAKKPRSSLHPEPAPNRVAAINALAWAADGLTEWEADARNSLIRISLSWPPVIDALLAKPWLVDGITRSEARFLFELRELILIMASMPPEPGASTTMEDVFELFEDLLSMPFMDTVEDYDAAAIYKLWKKHVLSEFRELPSAYPNFEYTFQSFQRSVSLLAAGGGITDDQAVIIANRMGISMYFYDKDTEELRIHLAPDLSVNRDLTIERRRIRLPLTGDMLLIVFRSESFPISTMDVLEESVRAVEHIMGEPFDVDHVVLFLEDWGRPAGGWDHHYIRLQPVYMRDEEALAYPGYGFLIHEVAHYYWQGGYLWVIEGAADFVADLSGKGSKSRLSTTERSCELDYISEIFEVTDDLRSCNYYLGARLFSELHDGLGSQLFHEGFKRLYLLRKERLYKEGVVPRELKEDVRNDVPGIDYVLRAFVTDASPEAAAIAEPIILHRYYGPNR